MSENGQYRILVVDDNPDVNRAVGILLRDGGYVPVAFQSAAPAMHYARYHSIDAALLDIHLPDRSGLELTRDLRREIGDELPILIMSGDTSMQTLRDLPSAGATFFLAKPVTAEVLMSRVRQCLKGRPLSAGPDQTLMVPGPA
jgi:DNA-binding response OmpR family regulator